MNLKEIKFREYLISIGVVDPLEQDLYTPVNEDEAVEFGFRPIPGMFIVHTNIDGTIMDGIDGAPFLELRYADGHLPTPGRRYSMRPGSGTHLFFPARLKELLDAKDFCVITEGAKKASVLSCLGFPCIGLTGWTTWRITGTDDLHDDFAQIQIRNRKFYLLPDFDGAFNPDIHREVQKLSLALYGAGAKEVRLIKLPPVSDKKMGVDDYLMDFTEEVAHAEFK